MPRRRLWDSVFLDSVIKKYLRDFDPVEQFIDYQCASISGSYDVKLTSSDFSHGVSASSFEDRLIDAIDRKYIWASSPEGVMWALYLNGYSFKAIAEIFDCTVSKVWEMVRSFQRKVSDRR